MTSDEKKLIKEIKDELVVLRLQMMVMTETEFKKGLDKVLKWVDELEK